MKYTPAIILLLTLTLNSSAQKKDFRFDYSAMTIPDSMKKNANAVLRLDEATLEISAPGKYQWKIHMVVTILNEKAAGYLRQSHGIDKFSKVDDIQLNVYNSLGILEKSYKKKDFTTTAAYDGITFVNDDKVMRLVASSPGYPCTVEHIYTEEVSASFWFPGWSVQNPRNSVEKSKLTVIVPAALDIRYQMKNLKGAPVIETKDKMKVYTWEYHNLLAKKEETGGSEDENIPQVKLAPNYFDYDGYKGEFKDWKSFGKWDYSLFEENSDPFSSQRVQEISSLVKDASSDNEKMEILYKRMQHDMRYVAITLGIGGYKPFPVAFVDEKKYGDCKALTNYMRYLLKEVGIKAYPALIRAGRDEAPMDTSFPISAFNHVILCVPTKKDTVWLECTSKDNDFNFLGTFTENRYALLLTENGGKIVKTPTSNFLNNKSFTKSVIDVGNDGSCSTSTKFACTGEEKGLFKYIKDEPKDDQKRIMVRYLKFRNPDEMQLDVPAPENKVLTSELKMSFEKVYDFATGSKMFISQRLNKMNIEDLPKSEVRETDYYFDYPFNKTDTTVFKLPNGFEIDNLPEESNLKCDVASYTSKCWFNQQENSVYTTATFILKKNRILAKDYENLYDFFNKVNKAESQKLVVKKP